MKDTKQPVKHTPIADQLKKTNPKLYKQYKRELELKKMLRERGK